MGIRQLRTLIAIAETGSFAAAADRVFVTQAAVSMQMKALEEEFGVTLFDRSRRPPELNEVGRALVMRALDIVRAYDRLKHLDADPDGIEGDLALGVVPSALTGLAPIALSALRTLYPRLHVDITSSDSGELVRLMERGTLDAVIVSDPIEDADVPDLTFLPLLREPLVVIAPLAAPEGTAEELLAGHPFIRFTRSAWVGRLIDDVLGARGIRVKEMMTLDTLEAVTAMVVQGLGVAIVPHRRVGLPLAVPVRWVPLAKPGIFRTLGLAHLDGHAKAPLIASLAKEIGPQIDAAAGRA